VESYNTIALPPDASSVRVARQLARAWLDDVSVENLDQIELIVAELVTNALEHGTPPIVLHVWRERDGIRLGVSDRNPVAGVVQAPDSTRPSGLGLRIVDGLAEHWGSAAHDDGKIVWVEMPTSATHVDLRTESGDPQAGVDAILDALTERADPTMVVVTASYRGERGGCLVGFHCQCSISPVRYAVWLSKANHTCRVALQATHLGIHFLGTDDLDLASLFGEYSGDEVDKFARCETTEGRHGVPLLSTCPDRVVAQRMTSMDDGSDHICFVVEPVDAHHGAARPPMRRSDVSHLEPGHAAEERAPVT
jgi:flavin reductase (DIM6/NTAB) family NADH-FMN oxidoreductase RutF/anti-sigma regulatory factor (Ser/Thr protein kinase)